MGHRVKLTAEQASAEHRLFAAMECQGIQGDLQRLRDALTRVDAACGRGDVDGAWAALDGVADEGMALADRLTSPPSEIGPRQPTEAARKAWETRVRKYGPTGRRQPGIVTAEK